MDHMPQGVDAQSNDPEIKKEDNPLNVSEPIQQVDIKEDPLNETRGDTDPNITENMNIDNVKSTDTSKNLQSDHLRELYALEQITSSMNEVLPSFEPYSIADDDDDENKSTASSHVSISSSMFEIPLETQVSQEPLDFQTKGVPLESIPLLDINHKPYPLNHVPSELLSHFLMLHLKSNGYDVIQEQALNLLTDVLSSYIERLGFLANSFISVPGIAKIDPMDIMNKVFQEVYPKGLEEIKDFWKEENKRLGIDVDLLRKKRQEQKLAKEADMKQKSDTLKDLNESSDMDNNKDQIDNESSQTHDALNDINNIQMNEKDDESSKDNSEDSSNNTSYLMREQCLQDVPFTKIEQKSYEVLYKDAFRSKSLRYQNREIGRAHV